MSCLENGGRRFGVPPSGGQALLNRLKPELQTRAFDFAALTEPVASPFASGG
jgi:hypothetical protein